MAAIAYGGESSVRVSAIATAVGVKEPSVYHFFKNRDALVEAAQIERYRRSYSEMIVPFELAAEMSETQEEFESAVRKVFSLVYAPERIEIRSIRKNVMGAAQSSEVIAKAISEINHETASTLARVMVFGQERGWDHQGFRPHGVGLLGHWSDKWPGDGRDECWSCQSGRVGQGVRRSRFGRLSI